MTVAYFLILLTFLSAITSLVTEAVKKFLDSMYFNYASNVVVLLCAVFVGGVGMAVYYALNGMAWTTENVIYLCLMILADWVGAMLGYDKVIQTITQIKDI